MSAQIDVLIIGGGPAGLAAAIACAQRGIRVMVCERQSYPVDKACGEGLMPTGLSHLQRLGVDEYIPADQSFSFTGIRYHSPSGQALAARFSEGPGLGTMRTVLSAALHRRAAGLDGIDLRQSCTAQPQTNLPGGILVDINGEEVVARLLVGADGLNSQVRRWAGLEGPPQSILRWGVRQHFRLAPWSEYVEVYWQKGIEAYITPVGPDLVGVAFLWERGLFQPPRGGKDFFPALLGVFPDLAHRLGQAAPVDAPLATGPLQRRVRAPVADSLLLLGDASGYLDAITGEGLSLAFAQAQAAAETAASLLKDERWAGRAIPRRALLPYARAHRRIQRPYLFFTRLALLLSRQTGWLDRLIPLLQKQPRLFQALLSMNMGLPPDLR